MVNRVGNGYTSNSYSSTGRIRPKADEDAPAFLLNYDEKGVVWDRGTEEKQKVQPKIQTPPPKTPIRKTYNEYVEEVDTKKYEDKDALLTENVSKFWQTVKGFFSKIINFIWYGEAADKNANIKEDKDPRLTNDVTSYDEKKAEKTLDNPVKNEKYISAAEKEKNEKMEIYEQALKKTPARNTSLLTTYNRHGAIRDISASESERILKPDKALKM